MRGGLARSSLIPTTRAKIPDTIFVIVLPALSKEMGCGARLRTKNELCRYRNDIFSDEGIAIRQFQSEVGLRFVEFV